MMLFVFSMEHLLPPDPVRVDWPWDLQQVTPGQRACVQYRERASRPDSHPHPLPAKLPALPFPPGVTLTLTFSHGYLMAKPSGAATHLLNNEPICEWGMEIGSQSAENSERERERIFASLTHGTVRGGEKLWLLATFRAELPRPPCLPSVLNPSEAGCQQRLEKLQECNLCKLRPEHTA